MTEQEQNDYVAAKMGIIFLCENCRNRVHSVSDKVGNVIGWIHTASEGVVCDKSSTHASPASLKTLEEMFNPPAGPKKITVVVKDKTYNIDLEADDLSSWFDKISDDYRIFKHIYDKWDYNE